MNHLLVICTVMHLTYCYSDDLSNSSLKLVPAALGSDVHLRCLKVVRGSGNYYGSSRSAICTFSERDGSGCGHMWSKNSTILGMAGNSSTSKYEFSAQTTRGYCSMFGDTQQQVDSEEENETGFPEFKCVVSILSIKNVTLDDLGVYKCNFSTHYDKFYRWENDPEIDFVEVELPGTKAMPKEVIYSDSAYLSNRDLMIQCLSTGENITWIFLPNNVSLMDNYYDCFYFDSKYESCLSMKVLQIPLAEFNSTDIWRSYNISVSYSSPVDDVYESFIVVRGASALYQDKIVCTVDGNTVFENFQSSKAGKLLTITENNRYDYYGDNAAVNIILTTLLLVLSLVMFFVVAAVRGKVCNCCQNNRQIVSIAVPVGPQPTAPLI